MSPSNYTVSEGMTIQIECQATGTQPYLRWNREGGQPLPDGVVQERNNIVIDSASRNHSGVYECIVTNSLGNARSIAVLNVNCKFKLVQ